MKKKNSGADNSDSQNKKETSGRIDSMPKNLSSRENAPLSQDKENKKANTSSRRNKPEQQQSECNDLPKQVLGRIPNENQENDENVIPEQGLGRIPDEFSEEVEEKSKNI